MPTIKKIGVLVSMFCLFLVPVSAESGRYGLSLSSSVGILYGQAEEILYKYAKGDQYLSELLWDLKPLLYTGIALDFAPRDPFLRSGFISGLSLKFGFPFKTGIMEDRDWDNHQYDHLTHYSQHDAYAQNAIMTDLSAGYSWRLTDFLVLGALGEFSFMYLSWSAENGYTQYPPYDSSRNYPSWDSRYQKNSFNGKGVLYTQYWFIFSHGIFLRGKINRFFSLEGTFNYSPLIYAFTHDDHVARDLVFKNYLYGGHFIQGGGSFIFSPVKNLDLSLSVTYRHITGSRGSVYWEATGYASGDPAYNGEGGAGYSALDVGLAAKIRVYGRD